MRNTGLFYSFVMDNKFTELIRIWLEKPESERDYSTGALYVLKLSGNKILYRNLVRNLSKNHADIEYQLQKYYNFRVRQLTHEQVRQMAVQAEAAVERNISLAAKADTEPKKGKRADHDQLPDEIKAKYVENLSLLQRMRELHLRLRSLSLENATCPDSERYPFLKELISLDKKLHANWEEYDHYVAPSPDAVPSRSAKAKRSAAGATKKSSKKSALS